MSIVEAGVRGASLFRGAHFWEAYAEVGGLMVVTRRRVVARLGTTPLPVLALSATLERFAIELAEQSS